MRKLSLMALMVLLGTSLVMAAPRKEAKKENIKGAPTAAQVEKAMNQVKYRTDAKLTKSLAGGKGTVTFVAADLGDADQEHMARGAILGKLVTDHTTSDGLEAGTYVMYVKKAGAWEVFYCQDGKAVARAKTAKFNEHNSHDPEWVNAGHSVHYWYLVVGW